MTKYRKIRIFSALIATGLLFSACASMQQNSETKKDIAAYFNSMYIVLPAQTRYEIEGSGKKDTETPPAQFQENVTKHCPMLTNKVDEALQNGYSADDKLTILSKQIQIGKIKEVCDRQIAEWKDKTIPGCKVRVFDKVEMLSGGKWIETAGWDWELQASYHILCKDLATQDTYGDYAREKDRMRKICEDGFKIKWRGYQSFRENYSTYRRVQYECHGMMEKNWSYKK